MKITSVRIKKNNSGVDTTLLGIASVQFDDCFIVHDIKLLQLKDRRVVSFPNKKVKKYILSDDGYDQNYEYTDIAHPSNREFREYVETELFRIYDADVMSDEGGKVNE